MVRISPIMPGQVAQEVWVYPTSLITARWADLAALKGAFFKKAETLGTDGGIGSPTISHAQRAAGAPLNSRLLTSAAINDSAYSWGQHDLCMLNYLPGGRAPAAIIFDARARLEQTTLCAFSLGFTDTADIEPPLSCAQIFYDTNVGANWLARSYGSAEEQTDTGVAADTAYHNFHIEIASAEVRFYIDGALEATHTTQIPDAGEGGFSPVASVVILTRAAAAKAARYVYVAFWIG